MPREFHYRLRTACGGSEISARAAGSPGRRRHRVVSGPAERMTAQQAASGQHDPAPGAMKPDGFLRIVGTRRLKPAGAREERAEHQAIQPDEAHEEADENAPQEAVSRKAGSRARTGGSCHLRPAALSRRDPGARPVAALVLLGWPSWSRSGRRARGPARTPPRFRGGRSG